MNSCENQKFVKKTVWKMKCFRCQAKTDHFGKSTILSQLLVWQLTQPPCLLVQQFSPMCISKKVDNLGTVAGLAALLDLLVSLFYLFVPHFTGHSPFLSFDSWLVTISPFRGFLLTRQWREQRLGGLSNVFF